MTAQAEDRIEEDAGPTAPLSFRKSVTFGFFTLFGILVLAETAARFLYVPTPPKEFRAFMNPEWQNKRVYKRDPVLFWKFRPSQTLAIRNDIYGHFEIPINNHGLRGANWPRETPIDRSLRILVIGDSCVFGWGAGADDSFPQQLEKILNEDRRIAVGVDVMNAGTPGYSSHQALEILKRWGEEYRPHWVIPFVGSCDALPCIGHDDLALSRISRGRTWASILEPFQSWRWLEDQYVSRFAPQVDLAARARIVRKNPSKGPRRVSADRFEKNLLEIHKLSRALGSRNLLLTRQNATPDPILEVYNQRLRKMAAETGIPLIEIAQAFLEHASAEVFANVQHDLVHPNTKGYRLIAEKVAEAIVRELEADNGEQGPLQSPMDIAQSESDSHLERRIHDNRNPHLHLSIGN